MAMAMVLNPFLSVFVKRIADLVEEEVVMLLEVKEELQGLKNKLETIKAVLNDAERKKIRDKSIFLWLSRLREVVYEADDLIDDCRIEGEKLAKDDRRSPMSTNSSVRCCPSFLSCFHDVAFHHEIGKRIKGINSELEGITNEIPTLQLVTNAPDDGPPRGANVPVLNSSPVTAKSDIVGIDEDANKLVDLLKGENTRKMPVHAIVGMGGIGKTTLAQKVFNDRRIESHFSIMIWVCVPRDLEGNIASLLRKIIRCAGGECDEGLMRDELDRKVQNAVEGKRFLLVLDDIWDVQVWNRCLKNPLNGAAMDSRILITTRNTDVAKQMGAIPHEMKLLDDEECWSMLCKMFRDDEMEDIQKLREIGMEIVRKCKGLPLAIKAIGGVLSKRDCSRREWTKVLKSQTWDLTQIQEGTMPDSLMEISKEIFPALYLSYEDLPSHLKQCFLYCSLYPEDFKFHQLNLIQIWIAEGFINASGTLTMEDMADQYYRELVARNLFQAIPGYYDRLGCTMHDLMRSLALYVSRNEYLYRDFHSPEATLAKPRHLSLVRRGESTVPDIKQEWLRTLLLSKNPLIKTIPDDFFDKLKHLRVLDLSYTGIENLPDSVGNLIHLRYLNISFTKLKELPPSVQCLQNLQTFNAKGCTFLHELPKGVVQLHNLRHLVTGADDTQLDHMPTGMEILKNLQTLYGFVVNDENGGQGECNLKELATLSQLRELSLYKLERVTSKEKAKEARLEHKINLNYLRLSCTRRAVDQQIKESDVKKIEEVFEGLCPPLSIEALHIKGFFGHEFPSCITNSSLLNLRWLELDDCKRCEQLPPLGELPNLRVLKVVGLSMVSAIGSKFCGYPLAFPKLQELYFWGLSEWKKWQGVEKGSLPCLEKLHIIKCPKLKSIPEGLRHATKLRELVIEGGRSLKVIENLSSVSELKVSNNKKLEVVSTLPALKVLSISNCPAINQVTGLNSLSHLLLSDDKMKTLPGWLEHITELQRLDVTANAEFLPSCSTDSGDWPKIRHIQRIEFRSNDGSRTFHTHKET